MVGDADTAVVAVLPVVEGVDPELDAVTELDEAADVDVVVDEVGLAEEVVTNCSSLFAAVESSGAVSTGNADVPAGSGSRNEPGAAITVRTLATAAKATRTESDVARAQARNRPSR